jgi:hypothetical protein
MCGEDFMTPLSEEPAANRGVAIKAMGREFIERRGLTKSRRNRDDLDTPLNCARPGIFKTKSQANGPGSGRRRSPPIDEKRPAGREPSSIDDTNGDKSGARPEHS